MNYTALEPVIPVMILDAELKPIPGYHRPYPSVNKCALYTDIDRKVVDKLIRYKHQKPYFCELLKQDIFILTVEDYEQYKQTKERPQLGIGRADEKGGA